VFRVNAKTPKAGDGFTQFGRAMSELNIDVICANTPAAKGRVERAHQTLQDRLVKELRLRRISAMPTHALSSRSPSCPTETFPETNRHACLAQTAVKHGSRPARRHPLPDISNLESRPTLLFGFDIGASRHPDGLRERLLQEGRMSQASGLSQRQRNRHGRQE